MDALVATSLFLRRALRSGLVLFSAVSLFVLDLLGTFTVPLAELRAEHAVLFAFWAVLLGQRVHRRARTMHTDETTKRLDLEVGVLLLVGVHATLATLGGLQSPAHPVIYVVTAFVASYAERPIGGVLVVLSAFFETLLFAVREQRTEPRELAVHVGFILLFGVMSALFTRVEIARIRARSKKELAEEREKVRDESRLFRLSSPSSRSESDDDRLFQSSVDEVHQSVFHVLRLLHRALDLHTCVALMLDDDQEKLRIVELVTDSDQIAEGPFSAGEGAVGAVAKRGQVMSLEMAKGGYKGLCYYTGPTPVKAFLGVPIVDGGVVIGALCVDRIEHRPFSTKEEALLEDATRQVLRALENERVFVQLERSKREQTVLFRASTALGAALDEGAVIRAGIEAARDIAAYDFAAITVYDAEARRHVVRTAVGEGAEAFNGLVFQDNTSLTAMAVKNRHYLPHRGNFDAKNQVVFTKRANLRGMESLLILPLLVRDDALGTIALAAHRKDAFGSLVRPTLQVLANQVAVALSNAAAVKRLEELATTDGLTGCLNKRAFLDELEKKLRSAQRFGKTLSLIVTDIDHFKSVNDTYGHATGDLVIKELGRILRRCKRDTDVVARFGGEEFCILLEETETEGAILFAERVREELLKTVFQTELGKLSVKASLGVATFPLHAQTAGDLFEASDKALYAAKHGGRNQVRTAA